MNKPSIKSFILESMLISEISSDWKNDFLIGSKGMPKTTEDVLNYIENIYFTAFGGENNIRAINKKMVKWLVEQINLFGGVANVGTSDREKLITVMAWFRVAGSEGNLPKMNLNAAFELSKNKLEEKNKKEFNQKNTNEFPEPPVLKIEEEGLAERVFVIPDGSGRVWVKVNQSRAGEFFDKLCDANKAYGVGCQSNKAGYSAQPEHRGGNRITYTLLGPEKGKKLPILTLLSLSVVKGNGDMREGKQVGNQPIGTSLYGWDDLFEKYVEFLGTPIARNTITQSTDSYTFSNAFNNKKFDSLNRLDSLRPDFIENSKNTILGLRSKEAIEWFENRNLDALEALKKIGPKKFIENLDRYAKSATFKEALQQLVPFLPKISKENPDLIISRINYLLDFLPIENFNDIISNVNLENYIITNKQGFENLLKKLTNVNSKDSKSYKETFKNILDNYFEIISRSFGKGNSGVDKFMSFLEMPKSDKHQFVRKNENDNIIALKKVVTVNPNGERTEKEEEFELPEQLAITTQKERRDLLKKNEDFIKSNIEGDSERKDINFSRMLFRESNPQEIQRTLKTEKDNFIKYYDNPAHITQHNTIRGVQLPGIFEFYRIFNKGKLVNTSSSENEKEKPYYKFDLEDLRNPDIAKIIINFFAKLYKVDNNASTIDASGQYEILDDYLHMLEISGESKEKILEIISKYKPSELPYYKDKNVIIPRVIYEKYYSIISNYSSSQKALEDIKTNSEFLIEKMTRAEYEKLLNGFSTPSFDVELGEMVEFRGAEKEDAYDEYDRRTTKRISLANLDVGKKYEVTRIVYPEESGKILNSKIRVLDNNKKETEWMNTSDFKVGIKYLNESNEVSTYIKKKLIEFYLKNKKNE